MQCKVCNAFIPEGYMYCPVCGEEIIIVSDFEIKLEDNIDVAALAHTAEIPDLSSIAYKRNITKELNKIDESDLKREVSVKTVPKERPKKKKYSKKLLIPLAVAGLIFLSGCIYAGIAVARYMSYDYQYKKAQKEFSDGDYKQAIKTGKHLTGLDGDKKGKILLADIYMADHNFDAAIAVLFDALNDDPQDVSLTDRIVECYKAENNNAGIHELISNSEDSTLALRYSDYVAISPTFSLESGTYIEPDPIKLSAPEDGTIYYTVDGSEPTEESIVYMGPIPLETGKTVISAMFINEKGIESEIVTNTYVVELDVPDPPELMVEPGALSTPQLIGVTAPENQTVYYTSDGSTPTMDSKEYSSPLLMPLGKSTYAFICVSESGLVSEPVTANYNLNMNVAVAKDMAEYAISYQLASTGEITVGKSYKAEYGFSDGSRSYYIINEYEGNKQTGRMFAVDVKSGELFRFSKEEKKCIRF
ncbi:MAG: chitobiase/beta-hexosaminidase C-terminal domain-containing protein [Lachnospiraceae bacterium]|nr:chitobiase/beta-hexosaminidase C-terminal domain-containing protein [Lachnospiraceae bacterium]